MGFDVCRRAYKLTSLTQKGFQEMLYCEKCGAEIEEDSKFCSKCGAPVAGYKREDWKAPRYECFGWERGGPLWGIIATGVFLIGLGVLWYFDFWWPGILFLIGLMIIVGALISYSRGGRRVTRTNLSK